MTIDRFDSDHPVRVLVFTSPKAGSGRRREQIPRLVEMLRTESVDVQITHEVDELRTLARAGNGSQVVVVPAGGDGTLSLAAAVVSMPGPDAVLPKPLIAPMPLGTENLLARHFDLSADAAHVIRTIRHGRCYQLDAGTANDLPFLIMASCGFDAEVVRAMHLTRRGHIRRLSYFNPIVRAVRRYGFPSLRVRVDDGETMECHWAMVFNLPRYGGGLKIEPDAVGDDGLFDVILFQKGSIPSGVKYATSVWLGQHLKSREVVRCRGKRIEIQADFRVPYQLDGDYAGRLPLRIEVLPKLVHLLVMD